MMRTGVVCLLALLLAAALPPVAAEEVDTVLVEDATGDVVVRAQDDSLPAQGDNGRFPDVDLTGAGIFDETPEAVTFFVQVASLEEDSQNPLPFSDPDYRVYFRYGDASYRVRMDTSLEHAANAAFDRESGVLARLEAETSRGQFRGVAQAEGRLDFGADRVYATVPRAAIVDHNQAPLSINSTLTGFHATASSMGWFNFPVGQTQQGGDPLLWVGPPMAFDQAPDMLSSLPSYQMFTGDLKQKGGLVAVSDDPVRWTNGEASTLGFQVVLTNTADHDIPVRASVEKTAPQWTVAFSDSLTVPRATSVNVTLLVTIPFSHNHGSLHMFQATYESLDGDHLAVADLGVYWPAVPQPAGHHDTIWLHSMSQSDDGGFFSMFDSGTHAWISATEDEEQDEGIAVPAMLTLPPNTFTGGKAISFWRVALEPELRMGLDFRPHETGKAEITIRFPTPVVDPVLSVQLSHVEVHERRGRNDNGMGESVTLAEARSEVVQGAVSGLHTFVLDLEILDEADDVPYQRDTNLFLTIRLDATFIAGFGGADTADESPRLEPGGTWMELPLDEYMVPVDLSFQTDGALELEIGSEGRARSVNPGKTTIYTFDLQYHGSEPITLRTLITGTHAEWAVPVGDAEFTMEPHGQRRLGMAVKAPSGTSSGERADLTYTVVSVANAAVQAGVNTVTTVDTTQDIPDEAARQKDLDKELTTSKKSPGLPLLVLLGALAVLARRR